MPGIGLLLLSVCLSIKDIPGSAEQQAARDHAMWHAPPINILMLEMAMQQLSMDTYQLQSCVWQHQLHYTTVTVIVCYGLLFTFPQLVNSCTLFALNSKASSAMLPVSVQAFVLQLTESSVLQIDRSNC